MNRAAPIASDSSIPAKLLADRIYSGEGIAADVVRVIAANILLVLCSHIVLPLPFTPVPITGQTFGVLLVAILLGSRRGMLTCVLYLLEGAAGLPVFQPLGLPGILRFAGPTAGYLVAYPAAAFVTGWLVERIAANRFAQFAAVRLAGALLAGEVIIFAGGCAWLALGMKLGWSNAIYAGALPFVAGELIKISLILAAARGVELVRERT
ncbi:MAG TPA: biotin transporter BioY [Terriglobales bacterium]|jgi:biotin transport system substrate-specific component|nr:biotin transporter BioY [Terriglobales bacterium]